MHEASHTGNATQLKLWNTSSLTSQRTIVLIPLFNDWEAAELLLADLDRALADLSISPEVLFINDGSSLPMPQGFANRQFTALHSVDVLELRRNLGHQRAIAVGLVFVYQSLPSTAVVVMDGDGEDRPGDIPLLADEFYRAGQRSIIFAARAKRLERLSFRALYHLYRVIHLLLTGDQVRVGNFSMVPFESLAKLVVVPEIWNHYAAAAIRSRLAFRSIPISRGRRLVGKSKMNFIALLLHGLSAFFVYGDIVGARLLIAIALALIVEVILVAAGVAVWFTTSPNIVVLAAYVAAILGILLLQAIPVALILVFTVIGSRVNAGFLPLRDCPYFVSSVQRVFPAYEHY